MSSVSFFLGIEKASVRPVGRVVRHVIRVRKCGSDWGATLRNTVRAILLVVLGLATTRVEAGIISATVNPGGVADVTSTPVATTIDFVNEGGIKEGSAFVSQILQPFPTTQAQFFFTDPVAGAGGLDPSYTDHLVLVIVNSGSRAISSLGISSGNAPYIKGGIVYAGDFLLSPSPQFISSEAFTATQVNVNGDIAGFIYDFQTSLAVGDSISFYIPLGIASGFPSSGTFMMTMNVFQVPEPAGFPLVLMGASGLVIFGRFRHRRLVSAASE